MQNADLYVINSVKKELAEVDLKMALQLEKDKKRILQTYNDWKNYELKRLAEKEKRLELIKNFIKDTLTYIFKDKQIFQKSAFLILFMLLSSYSQLFAFNFFSSADKVRLPFINFAVLFLLALFVLFFINGYKVDCIKNLMSKSEIPAFNLKKSFQFGVKYTFAAALFYLPLHYLIFGCAFFWSILYDS